MFKIFNNFKEDNITNNDNSINKSKKFLNIFEYFQSKRIDNPLNQSIEFINQFNEISKLINKNKYELANMKLLLQNDYFKKKKYKPGIELVNAYHNLIDGVEAFGASNYKNAINNLLKALKTFNKFNFDFECFKTYTLLGLIYSQTKGEDSAFKFFNDALRILSTINEKELKEMDDEVFINYLINKIFHNREKIKDSNVLIWLYKYKLNLINKKTHIQKFKKIESELIKILLEKNDFDNLVDHLFVNNISLNEYFTNLIPIFEDFKDDTILNKAITVSKILSLKFTDFNKKSIYLNWVKELYPLLIRVFNNNYREIVRNKEIETIINFLYKNKIGSQLTVLRIANSLDNFFKTPTKVAIETSLDLQKKLFKQVNNDSIYNVVNIWINIVQDFKNISEQNSYSEDQLNELKLIYEINLKNFTNILNEILTIFTPIGFFSEVIQSQLKRFYFYFKKIYLNQKCIFNLETVSMTTNYFENWKKNIQNGIDDSNLVDNINNTINNTYNDFLLLIWKDNYNYEKSCFKENFDQIIIQFLIRKINPFQFLEREPIIAVSIIYETLNILETNQDKSRYLALKRKLYKRLTPLFTQEINNSNYEIITKIINDYNIQVDDYIHLFTPLINSFKIDPTIKTANLISTILLANCSKPESKEIQESWFDFLHQEFYKLFRLSQDVIFKDEYTQLINILFKKDFIIQQYINDISILIRDIITHNNDNLKFLERLKYLFEKHKKIPISEIFNSWLLIATEIWHHENEPNFDLIFENLVKIIGFFLKFSTEITPETSIPILQVNIIKPFFDYIFSFENFHISYQNCESFMAFIEFIKNVINNLEKEENVLFDLNQIINTISLSFYIKSWQSILAVNSFTLKKSVDPDLISILTNRLYELIPQIKNDKISLSVLNEKRKSINKETDIDIYNKISNQISKLIKNTLLNYFNNNDYNSAIDLINTFKIPIIDYIDNFKQLYKSFNNNPDIDIVNFITNFFTIDFFNNIPESMVCKCGEIYTPNSKVCMNCKTKRKIIPKEEIFFSWKKKVSDKIYTFFIKNIAEIIKLNKYKHIVNFIFSNIKINNLLNDITQVVRDLFLYPEENKTFLGFLLLLNEKYQDIERHNESQIINRWIQLVLKLKKIRVSYTQEYFDLILQVLKETEDSFIPLLLIEKCEIENKIKNTLDYFNNLSDFLYDLTIFIYDHPNINDKDKFFDVIEKLTNYLGKKYQTLIIKRMRARKIQEIQLFGNMALPFFADRLFEDISIKNPYPIVLCFKYLYNKWAEFPLLSTIIGTNIFDSRTVSIKIIFWFFVFKLILTNIIDSYGNRLTKNEKLKNENMKRLIAMGSDIIFMYTIDPEFSISKDDIFDEAIKFFKLMYEKFQLSDEYIEEVIQLSNWNDLKNKILKKIIEIKNYCIYCNYNMPPKSKKCPNCGKKVGEISSEETKIDLDSMSDFFNSG
ncbi:MAG: tetratricopeptide repeat protein [Candidatus Helarchaeota archaeon]